MSPGVRPPAVRFGDRLAAWSVFLIVLAVYTATFRGLPESAEAEAQFQTASAIARRYSTSIGGTPEAERLIESGEAVVSGGAGRPGRSYSRYGIGGALANLPLYLIGSQLARFWPEVEDVHAADLRAGHPRSEYFAHLAVGWRNALLGALTAGLLVVCGRRLGLSRFHAWASGMTYALCTYAWPQAAGAASDVLVAFLAFGAFHLLVRVREKLGGVRAPRVHRLAAIGLCLGGALLARPESVLIVAVLAWSCWRVLRAGHRRIAGAFPGWRPPPHKRLAAQALAVALPLLACAAIGVALNQLRLDSLLTPGEGEARGEGAGGLLLAAAVLVAAPGGGLLWMAPGLLLVPAGLNRARERGAGMWIRASAGVAAAALTGILASGEGPHPESYGPRHLLPLVPFALLGLGFALARRPSRAWIRTSAAALCGLGLVIQVPGVLVAPSTRTELALQALAEGSAGREHAAEATAEARERIAWDWRFAAPWAQWRILRHRAAGMGEEFPASEVFLLPTRSVLRTAPEGAQGFRHLAWVDLSQRLRGAVWPGLVFCALLLGVGVALAARALDRD